MQYCGYKINCNECGEKQSVFSVDKPYKNQDGQSYAELAFERQKKEITVPKHQGHTYKYTAQIIGATKAQFDTWVKQNGLEVKE